MEHHKSNNLKQYGFPSLINSAPEISGAEILSGLRPPPEFHAATFDGYFPDDSHPSQALALERARGFVQNLNAKRRRDDFNIYLDGGFGVGKTHLLAAAWNSFTGSKLFGSFLEFTSLVGYLGYPNAKAALGEYRLICIDEFELDDPGDTMIMSRLLKELDLSGTRIAATSNTPPAALGQGRFAADDFRREIAAMAGRFEMITIDGDDYRHRSVEGEAANLSEAELIQWATRAQAHLQNFDELLHHLSSLHQVKYRKLIADLSGCAIAGIHRIEDQLQGLRFVVFIDRLYEQQIPLRSSGELSLSEIFSSELLESGYRKKYLRCQSRILALSALS